MVGVQNEGRDMMTQIKKNLVNVHIILNEWILDC